MPEIKIAGPGGTSWSASGGIYMDGVPLPTGRAMANGSQACLITEVYGYVSGRGGTRTGRLQLGSAASGNFNVGAASSGQPTGWYGTNEWLVQGGSTRWGYYFTNGVYFGKEAFGPTTVTDGSTNWSGFALGGHFRYAEAPSAPQSLTAVAHPTTSGAVNINFTNPASDGGAGLVDFRIYMNGAYKATTYQGANTITGLTPGTSYSFYIRATNRVTQLANTESVASSTVTVVAPGVPSAPRSVIATPSTSVYGRIALSWTAPLDTAGGITGYRIYRGSTLLGTSETTSYTASGLAENTTVELSVAARNSYADSKNTESPRSTSVFADVPGHPRKPENMAAAANPSVAGQILLSWASPQILSADAPVTRYSVYYSTGVLIGYTTGTTYTVSGLVPGTSYGFYTRAWNAVADTNNDPGPASTTATVQATGEPDAPTGVTVSATTLVAGRLNLSWAAPAGVITGFNVYRNGVKVASTLSTGLAYASDGLTPGTSYSFFVKARNAITDQNGTDGPASATVSGVPGSTTTQTTAASTVQNATNAVYNGTYTISAQTPTTFSYARSGVNSGTANITSGFGSVVNNTNTILNGSYVITSTGLTTFTYPRTTGNIAANTATTGKVLNTTNSTFFNGTKTVTSSSPTTVSFAAGAGTITNRASGGTISNTTNAVFNGTNIPITAVTASTMSYAKTNANIAESTASGSVTNRTNIDAYNGVYTVDDTPLFNTFTYKRINEGLSTGTKTNLAINPSFETATAGTTVVRTNFCTNPSFEVDSVGFESYNAGTIARSTADKYSGVASLLVTAAASSQGVIYTAQNVLATSSPVTWSVRVKGPAGLVLDMSGRPESAARAYISEGNGNIVHTLNGEWQSVTGTWSHNGQPFYPNVQFVARGVGTFYIDDLLVEQTDQLRPYFDGSTPDALGFDYGWTGVVGASTSTAKAAVVEVRRNLAVNPNFETNLTGWGASSVNITLTRDLTTAKSGTASAKAEIVTAAVIGDLNTFGSSTPAAPGEVFTASAHVKASASGNMRVTLEFRDAGNVIVGSVASVVLLTGGAGFVRMPVTATAPASTATLFMRVGVDAVSPVGFMWWVDDAQIEKSPVLGTYFDGSTPSAGDLINNWAGTADASASVRSGVAAGYVAGGASVAGIQSFRWGKSGARSLRQIPISDLASAAHTRIPGEFVAGRTYTVLATSRLDAPITGTSRLWLTARQSGGTVIAGGFPAPNVAGEHPHRLTFTAGASTDMIWLEHGGLAGSGDLWWDDILIVEGAYTGGYFDGDTPSNGLTTYAWTGTAEASTSTGSSDHVSAPILTPYGDVYRNVSLASLMVKYRSGWAG